MTETMLNEIAEKADMIIRGYAFTKEEAFVRIFNLNDGKSFMMINLKGKMLASSMDEIEQALVLDIWEKNKEYMEKIKSFQLCCNIV